MHDPRTSSTLRLADLTGERPRPRWSWAIAPLDAKGRLCLPREALGVLGDKPFSVRWNRLALVLDADSRGTSRVDGRGRLLVPVWMRRGGGRYPIGTDAVRDLIAIAPTHVLDAFGDALAGADR